jgi:ATP-dependent RNA helicase SUPV3L1/SUV3
MQSLADDGRSIVRAVLGPTNTGKTHRAIERLLEHESGVIGLPLRLLAREVYDRITRRIGEAKVALVTGEEKRAGSHPRYWVCTVEAMPQDLEVDFVAVDEIQLAAHPERGHVFTDRILRARGRKETWFLGADTMRPLVERLVPVAAIQRHPRLSRLSAVGSISLAALPPRSAVVAFSTPRVYEIAERIRSRRGGAAVVLGALSPRARNAQVALYQSGEVDYMVATDAIGMGLNMDVDLVAFADLRKFDGRETRDLEPAELAQIAGRAGRHHNDGTFATLGPLPPLSSATSRAIEMHTFPVEQRLWWRNADLDKSSARALVASLPQQPKRSYLRLVQRVDDFSALVGLVARPEIEQRARGSEAVGLLWDVCQIPDFRKLMLDDHTSMLADIFLQLAGPTGRLDERWINERVGRVDDVDGDIDALLMRMAFIRTWTYVAHHTRWLANARAWQERTRNVEDRLSDALHERLIQRFVDRSRPLPHRRPMPRKRGQAVRAVDDERDRRQGPFSQLANLKLPSAKLAADAPVDDGWLEDLIEAPYERFTVDPLGRILDGERAIGQMTRGVDLLRPEVALALREEMGSGLKMRIVRRLMAWTRDLVSDLLAPLQGEGRQRLSAAARGLVYQLEQGLGTVRAETARDQLASLSEDDHRSLASLGVKLGATVVYVSSMLKPAAILKRTALCAAFAGGRARLALPRPGAVSLAKRHDIDPITYQSIGYPVFGPRAIRADVAERVHQQLASADAKTLSRSHLASWMGCPASQVPPILAAMVTVQGPSPDIGDASLGSLPK